ncbi:MAG: cyclic nucleotide-binding domain-containing protein [Caldilineaceae bacterium]|nr:cyclic nucleotide-binding domain-containing protein [Caldilineaceae bacterium]
MKQEFIQFAPLFAGLAEDERIALDENFAQNQLTASAPMFSAGSTADGLYLVGKGFVRLMTPGGINLATLGPGSVLGEDSLFRSLPYDVSAVAVSDLEFWKLSDKKLRELILQRPALGLKLSNNFGSLIAQMQDYLVQQLARTTELSGVPANSLQVVAGQLQPRRLASGQYLYRVGEPPAGLFLIENGVVDVQTEGADTVETFKRGDLLGAIALLTNKASTSTAVATQDTELWMLATDDFQAIAARQPGLRRNLGRNVRSRLGRTDQMAAVLRLGKMPIFAELSPQVLQQIAQRMILQHVPAGERVYRIGEAGDAMCLVESGEIELTAENAAGIVEEIGRIGNEGFFGEMSLVTGQMRTEDATATRNSNLFVLYKADLDALATQNPAIGKALSQGVATRLASQATSETSNLQRFALFAGINPSDLQQIANYLHPMRYRTGEQVFRMNTPAEHLYLIEKGQVRVQPLAGAGWLLGPGESFGERAVLTSQPHNTSVTAETDLDVWTLAKSDFDMLMNRYPTLAITMSRILSQRLTQMTAPPAMGPVGAAPTGQAANAPPAYLPSEPAPANLPSARRRAAAAASGEVPAPRRGGFGAWYGNLSGFGKLRFVLLIMLMILLLCVTVPFTVYAIINGPAAAIRATTAVLERTASSIAAPGSYEVAAADMKLVERLRAADAQVPATPTYTPFPTDTPQPTFTPLPTNTPTPAPTNTPQPVAQVFAAQLGDTAAGLAAPADTPTPEPPAAPAIAARNLDGRLGQLGINIEDAAVQPGQQYWRLVEVRFEDEQQAGGKHHIYADVIDENGKRVVGQPVTVFWGDGNYTAPLEDKPAPDFGFNYQMYAAGYAYNVKAEGLPSDVLRGAGLGDVANRFAGIHVAYYLTFQRATK